MPGMTGIPGAVGIDLARQNLSSLKSRRQTTSMPLELRVLWLGGGRPRIQRNFNPGCRPALWQLVHR